MSTDILYPVLIGGGCVALVVIVHLLTRPKPTRADITVPDAGVGAARSVPTIDAPVAALTDWHRSHEPTLLGFFEAYDTFADPGFELDATDDEFDVDTGEFEDAVTAHPAPEMRAELAAVRAAAESLRSAQEREDTEAVDRHRDVYTSYRHAWLERLWQFCVDHDRVADLRSRDFGAA